MLKVVDVVERSSSQWLEAEGLGLRRGVRKMSGSSQSRPRFLSHARACDCACDDFIFLQTHMQSLYVLGETWPQHRRNA